MPFNLFFRMGIQGCQFRRVERAVHTKRTPEGIASYGSFGALGIRMEPSTTARESFRKITHDAAVACHDPHE